MPASPLALPARTRTYLLLSIFLAGLPNTRADRTQRNSSRKRISSGTDEARRHPLLVCAVAVLVFEWLAHADGGVLGRHPGVAAVDTECLAARDAADLHGMFPSLCKCGA